MSTPAYTIPLNIGATDNQGNPVKSTLQLVLPSTFPNGPTVWSQTTSATGKFVAQNDGRSAFYTSKAVGSDTVTATVTIGSSGQSNPWQAGKLYRIGDQILDQNGHIQQVTAAKRFIPTRYTPNAGSIPQGGDSTQSGDQYGGTIVSGSVQFGTVLNTEPSVNGDWPAGALVPGLKTAAPVSFVGAGYSSGHNEAGKDVGPAGIDSPNAPLSNDSRVQIADYSPYGPGGLPTYLDAAGNSHTGWQVAKGSQVYTESIFQPPTFSTSGGATIDGELTWTDEGAAATATAVAAALTVAAGAFGPAGNFLVLGS